MFYRRPVRDYQHNLTFKEYVKDFLQESTIGGLRNFASPRLHPLECILWILVLSISIYAGASIIYSNWERYETSPIVESIERVKNGDPFENPALTICFHDKVDETSAKDYIKSKWGDVNSTMERYYMKYIHTVMNMSFRQLSGFKEFAGDPSLETVDMIELGRKVHFNNSKANLDIYPSFFRASTRESVQTVNELGFCYTSFSSIQQKYDVINNSSDPVQLIPCTVPLGCGVTGFITGDRSYQMAAHSNAEIPDITTKFLLGPEGAIIVYLDLTQFMSSPRIRQFSPKRRNCIFRDEGNVVNLPEYSYNTCMMKCRRKLAIKLCGCSPPFYEYFNAHAEDQICNITGLVCLSENTNKLLELLNKKVGKKHCGCLPPCDQTIFRIFDTALKKTATLTGNAKARALSVISIIVFEFSDLRCKKDILFTFQDLLVSFGGTAGFFLGCSILSFLELIYFFTLRLICYLCKRRKINTAPEPRRYRFLIHQSKQ